MPGIVAGLAILWIFLFVKPLTPLRQTMFSVWLAYTIVWLAYGMRLVQGTSSDRTRTRRSGPYDRCD
jgi:iron(III) transport system permease protein